MTNINYKHIETRGSNELNLSLNPNQAIIFAYLLKKSKGDYKTKVTLSYDEVARFKVYSLRLDYKGFARLCYSLGDVQITNTFILGPLFESVYYSNKQMIFTWGVQLQQVMPEDYKSLIRFVLGSISGMQ